MDVYALKHAVYTKYRKVLTLIIFSQSLYYLGRLDSENVNPFLKEAFILSKLLDSHGTYSWFTYAKNISPNPD